MTDMAADPIETLPGAGPVRRVLVRWNGREWMVSGEVRVPRMTLPAPDPLPAGDASRGFWIELVGPDRRVRHRQVMSDPLAGMEQFEEDGEISRTHPPHDITIELLVPDIGDAELHLVSNAPDPNAGSQGRPKRAVLYLSSKPDDPGEDGPPIHHLDH